MEVFSNDLYLKSQSCELRSTEYRVQRIYADVVGCEPAAKQNGKRRTQKARQRETLETWDRRTKSVMLHANSSRARENETRVSWRLLIPQPWWPDNQSSEVVIACTNWRLWTAQQDADGSADMNRTACANLDHLAILMLAEIESHARRRHWWLRNRIFRYELTCNA